LTDKETQGNLEMKQAASARIKEGKQNDLETSDAINVVINLLQGRESFGLNNVNDDSKACLVCTL
jgi:hypothetical protein